MTKKTGKTTVGRSRSAEYVRTLGPFDGVDPIKANDTTHSGGVTDHLEYTENLWKDPVGGDGISFDVIPGFRRAISGRLDGKVYGIWQFSNGKSGKKDIAVHAGEKLYIYPQGDLGKAPFTVSGINAARSSGISLEGGFMLWDGVRPLKVIPQANGSYSAVTVSDAYIPTVFADGEKHEKINLLSEYAYETRRIPEPSPLRVTRSLKYVFDPVSRTASVTGISTNDALVCITGNVTEEGIGYTVTEISDGAFRGNPYIKAVFIDSGVSVGESAFEDCGSLTFAAFLPGTSALPFTVGARAFYNAPLEKLFLSDSVTASDAHTLSVGTDAFGKGLGGGARDFDCAVYYELSRAQFEKVGGASNICSAGYTDLHCGVTAMDRFLFYSVPVSGNYTGAESTEIDGVSYVPYPLFRNTVSPQTVRYYMLFSESREPLGGLEAKTKFRLGASEPLIDLCKCRAACLFDGRIFLGGCSDAAGTVFYSGERYGESRADPMYFPVGNRITLGQDTSMSMALLPTPSALIVIKEGRDGAYYLRSKRQADGKVYYSDLEGAENVGALGIGSALSVGRTVTAVSADGVFSIDGTSGGNKKVNADSDGFADIIGDIKRVLPDASRICLCSFLNYTVLTVDGNMYLKDRNLDGGWAKLTGIGIYEGQGPEYVPVCRDMKIPLLNGSHIPLEPNYSKSYDGGTGYFIKKGQEYFPLFIGHDRLLDGYGAAYTATGTAFDADELYTYSLSEGVYRPSGMEGVLTVGYYPEIEGGRYYVSEPDGAMTGGSFDGSCFAREIDGKLYFGTGKGYLCVFNTDKRGKQVYRIDTGYKGGKNAVIGGKSLPISAYDGTELYYTGEAIVGDNATDNGFGREVLCMPYGGGYCLLCEPRQKTADGRIHPYYYTFDGRAIYACALTGKDNFGDAGYAKSTSGGSVIAVMSDVGDGSAALRCRTDKEPFFTAASIGGGVSGEELDFSSFSFVDGADSRIFAGLPERCRGYMWKQYHIGGRCFRSPFGITMISCRYKKGRYRPLK